MESTRSSWQRGSQELHFPAWSPRRTERLSVHDQEPTWKVRLVRQWLIDWHLLEERNCLHFHVCFLICIVTFWISVEGGMDKSTSDFFNPLYISEDPFGGYGKLSKEERTKTRNWFTTDPSEHVGRLCLWSNDGKSRWYAVNMLMFRQRWSWIIQYFRWFQEDSPIKVRDWQTIEFVHIHSW